MSRRWQVQQAKADFSAVIRAAEMHGPQTITRNGKNVAVLLSTSDFERLSKTEPARQGSLLEFFATWPPLDLPKRDPTDAGREVNF